MALACLTTACAVKKNGESEARVYKDGMFTDVTASSPYRDYVAAVYELGLMTGVDKINCFGASEGVTSADAISIIARLHSVYTGDKYKFKDSEPWYQTYVDYAKDSGFLQAEPDNYTQDVTRG